MPSDLALVYGKNTSSLIITKDINFRGGLFFQRL